MKAWGISSQSGFGFSSSSPGTVKTTLRSKHSILPANIAYFCGSGQVENPLALWLLGVREGNEVWAENGLV